MTENANKIIQRWILEKDKPLIYMLLIDNLLYKYWSDLDQNCLFFPKVCGFQKKVLWTLMSYYNLRLHVINGKTHTIINQKYIDDPPLGVDIVYHSPRCQDCPEISHDNGKKCSKKNCQICLQIINKVIWTNTEKSFYFSRKNIQKNIKNDAIITPLHIIYDIKLPNKLEYPNHELIKGTFKSLRFEK